MNAFTSASSVLLLFLLLLSSLLVTPITTSDLGGLQPRGGVHKRRTLFQRLFRRGKGCEGQMQQDLIGTNSNNTGGSVDGDGKSLRGRRFAYYVTGHGYGHATRVVEVCRELLARGHSVLVCTLAPPFIFTEDLPGVEVRRLEKPLDVGGVQLDALSVDPEATLRRYYDDIHMKREELIEAEAKWLSEAGIDMVLVDSPALPCAASKRAKIPAVVVTNLIWSHIYGEYILHCRAEHRGRYRTMIDQIAEDYACATALLRLPGYSPMEAFRRCRRVVDMPLVVRKARQPADVVRRELGLPQDAKLVLVTFGGQQTDWQLSNDFLPPGWVGIVTVGPKDKSSSSSLPSRYRGISQDVYMPDVVNAVDAVIGKIGYGTTSEVIAHRVPLIYVPRLHWNEQQYLLTFMQRHGTPIEMSKEDFTAGQWGHYLKAAYRLPRANNRRAYRGPMGQEASAVVVKAVEDILVEQEQQAGSSSGGEGVEEKKSGDVANAVTGAGGKTRTTTDIVIG